MVSMSHSFPRAVLMSPSYPRAVLMSPSFPCIALTSSIFPSSLDVFQISPSSLDVLHMSLFKPAKVLLRFFVLEHALSSTRSQKELNPWTHSKMPPSPVDSNLLSRVSSFPFPKFGLLAATKSPSQTGVLESALSLESLFSKKKNQYNS